MKSNGILNIELSKLIAKMGHGDMIAIVDRGFPVPTTKDVECIDLAIKRDLPKVREIVDVILDELTIEKKIFAEETIVTSKDFYNEINRVIGSKGFKVKEEIITHKKFKEAVLSGGFGNKEIRGYIRTGEFTFFANIIIVSGVSF